MKGNWPGTERDRGLRKKMSSPKRRTKRNSRQEMVSSEVVFSLRKFLFRVL
jgi:hypothetical protein